MRTRGIASAALTLSILASRAPAEFPATSPSAPNLSAASRILHTFDFEERARGNFEATPMFWSKVVGRGFPAYASGRFDHDIFRSAKTSFRLDIDSGSAAYQFVAPVGQRIPIDANADYHIIGFVKTTALAHAKAEIVAWFADDQGKLLPQTEAHSESFSSAPDADPHAPDGWHVLHVFIPGPRPNSPEAAQAKTLVLQLGLLQPQQVAGGGGGGGDNAQTASPLGKFQLYQQDLKGSAWFDDITVFQLPRVSIEVPPAITANIFHPDQPVALDFTVSDLVHATPALPGEAARPTLAVALRITDPDGLLFASEKWPVATDPAHPWLHHYTHPQLPPGLYTATLDVTDNASGSLISRRQTRFLCVGTLPVQRNDNGTEKVAPEFGLSATQWPTESWSELPTILRDTNVGLVQLPAWRHDMSEEQLRQHDQPFDTLLATLQRADVHVIGAFSELPAPLAAKLSDNHPQTSSSDSLLALATADPTLWRPYSSFVLARYSALVDRWQLGAEQSPFSGAVGAGLAGADDPYPALYAKCYEQLAGLLNQPRLVIPWNALFDFNPARFPNAVLDLRIPSAIKPAQIPSYVRDFQAATTPNAGDERPIFVHIDPLEPDRYAPDDRAADFAQRIIYSRSANPTATLIDLPAARRAAIASIAPHTEPDQLFLVYRTLVRTLGNAAFRGEVPLRAGAHAFLFARDDTGTLTLWSANPSTFDLPLGDAPRAIDLAGNIRPLPVDTRTHLTHLQITSTPILIDHVDASLLELSASFACANPVFPAGAGVVRTDILLRNPYTSSFSATMQLLPPPGWTIDPPSLAIAIPPGGTFRQAVTIRYPYNEVAGPKTIAARLTDISAQATPSSAGAPSLAVSCDVSITSDTVETDGFARVLPNGDLAVQQMVTNIASTPLNTQAYALVPGYARQQRFVLNLAPGQTAIKRFSFPMTSYVDFTAKTTPADIAAALTGKSAALGLRQTDGKTLLTKSIPIN